MTMSKNFLKQGFGSDIGNCGVLYILHEGTSNTEGMMITIN